MAVVAKSFAIGVAGAGFAASGDPLGHFALEAASEDGEAAEERLLLRSEQTVTPGDGVPHGAMAGVAAGPPGAEMNGEALQHLGGGVDVGPAREELDSQGQAVDPGAQGGDGGSVLAGGLEIVIETARAKDEELDGVPAEGIGLAGVLNDVQRVNVDEVLGGQPGGPAGSDQHRERGTRIEQPLKDFAPSGEKVFEVVEHEEQGAAADLLLQA